MKNKMSLKIKYKDFVKTYSKAYHLAEYYPEALKCFKQGENINDILKYLIKPYGKGKKERATKDL